MRVDVRYFAAARDLAGRAQETLELDGREVAASALLEQLCIQHPRLEGYRGRLRLAVNDELAQGHTPVGDGDVVSVMPPVAGGTAGLCALRERPLSVDEALEAVRHPGAGAVALFIGMVRDHAGETQVSRLEYEAHPSLAEKELRRLVDEVATAQPTARLAVTHRVGTLQIGDLAVVVAASAPHRAEAFTACRELIEQLKARVPIWKREWSATGEPVWVNLEG